MTQPLTRTILTVALAALLGACQNDTANAPDKDVASATATVAAATATASAKAADAQDHGCGQDCDGCDKHAKGEGCGDCAGKGAEGHECGGDCAGCDKHAKGESCGKDCGGDCAGCEKAGDCACAAGKNGEAVWCDKCNKGFVDGQTFTDKAAFEQAKAAKK